MSTTRDRRDTGIEHLSSVTRWLAAAAIFLTGLFTAAVVHAFPGHTKSTTAPAGGAATTGPTGAAAGSDSAAGSNGLQPPSQPPTVSTSPPQVASGGS